MLPKSSVGTSPSDQNARAEPLEVGSFCRFFSEPFSKEVLWVHPNPRENRENSFELECFGDFQANKLQFARPVIMYIHMFHPGRKSPVKQNERKKRPIQPKQWRISSRRDGYVRISLWPFLGPSTFWRVQLYLFLY